MKNKHYLSNKDLYCEIVVSKAKGRLSTKALKMMMLMTKNIMSKLYYYNPDDRLDCYQEAMYQLLHNWYKFDTENYDNAFAYYTEVIKKGLAKSFNEIHKTKGDDVQIISLFGTTDDGEVYERF